MSQITNRDPSEVEAWKLMMDSMIKFIGASTQLMTTINQKAAMSYAIGQVPGEINECEVECIICSPDHKPKNACQCSPAAPTPAASPAKSKAAEQKTASPDVGAEDAPVEAEAAEGEDAPAEGEAPTEGEDSPAEGEDAPAEGEEAPPEGEDSPPEGEGSPEEGEEAPAEGEEAPAEGESGDKKETEGEKEEKKTNCVCEDLKAIKAEAKRMGVLPSKKGGCACSTKKSTAVRGPEAGQRKQAAGGEADCVCTNSGKPGGCAAVSNEVEKRQLNPETDCICKKKEAAPPKEKKECSTDTKKKPMADAGEGEEMMCACDPSDAETKNIQDELIIKLNKAQEEILTLQMEMAKLQRMEADKKSKSAILYKEIMKGVDDCPTTCPGRSTPQFPQQSARPQSPPPGKNSSRQSSDPTKDDCYCPREQSSARTQTAAMPYGGSPYGKNPAMNMRSPQQYGGYPGQQMVQCVYKRPTGVAGDEYGGQQYQQPYSPQYGGYGQSTYQSAQIPCGTPQKPCPKQKSSSSQKGPCGTPQKICPSQQVGYDMYQGAQDGSGIVCYDYPDVPQGYDMMGGYQMQPYEDYGEEDDPCDNYTCGNEDCDNYSG